MAEEYNVRVRLELDRANRARKTLGQLSNRLSGIRTKIGSINSGANRLTRNLLAIGATYLGIRALWNAFRGIGGETVRVNSEVEDMQVALATLMASAERITFERAERSAGALFRRLNDIAVQSPATATQLMDIFRGVYGPLRQAGTGMEDLLSFTRNAASVGAALQVDYQQLSRDVMMMATGVAGTDVKTFRLLRSMNLITKSTEEWNRMAQQDSAKAAEELLKVFDQLGGPAADAFGRTWTGVSSTFKGLVEQFMRVFTGPSFAIVRDTLRSINTFLLRYRSNLENVLRFIGSAMASRLQRIVNKTKTGLDTIVQNMDAIARKIDGAIDKFNEIKPLIAQIAKVLLIAKAVTLILAPLLSIIGTVVSMAGGLAGAGAAGGGAAAGAGAAGGGIFATLSAAIGPLIAIVGAVIAVFVGVWRVISQFPDRVAAMFTFVRGDLTIIWNQIKAIAADLWDFLGPIFQILGAVVIAAVSGFINFLVPAIRVLVAFIRVFTAALAEFGTRYLAPLAQKVTEFFLAVSDGVRWFWSILIGLAEWLERVLQLSGLDRTARIEKTPAQREQLAEAQTQTGLFQQMLEQLRNIWSQGAEGEEGPQLPGGPAPGTRPRAPVTNIGRVVINQEFREADPDRVWIQVRDAIEREATHRTQSGFVPIFSR